MNAIEQVRLSIGQEIFDYTQLMMALTRYRKPRDVVTDLLKKNQIVRIRKGLYIFGPLWQRQTVSAETLANLVYGPSVISLEYALSWHGLIPEHVRAVTSVTSGRSREFDTPAGWFSYIQIPPGKYAWGIAMHGSVPATWLMTEPLKALADKVWTDKRFQPVSAQSFRDYLFSDLRVDESLLEGFIRESDCQSLEKVYNSRKISFMLRFLEKHFGG
jgi:hypothetical protein